MKAYSTFDANGNSFLASVQTSHNISSTAHRCHYILVVLSGKAILTVLKPDDRNSFNLERGDTIKLPAGTIAYLVNRDDNKELRVLDLAIPVNRPGQLQSFLLSGNKNQQNYLSGFSKNILEASFNTDYEEIEKVLLEEHEKETQHRRSLKDKRQQSQEENVIVKLSRGQIEELSKNAKSTSKKSVSSESEPFNLRSRGPIYSNEFGKFFEITPEKNPQLQDLDIFVNSVEIKEGSLLPSSCRKASSNLDLLGFGINAENNQRNFLAGDEDNVISQIQRPVKELAFPGSAQEVDRILENQKQSHFADAQPQQRERGSRETRDRLSSV
ncbi:hypothetical protein KIW84_055579 [Lathyrus oleraceus]|uniref:Cupin type-1 domain-containing protein n=1 Tax=Pisum sativum TaxID=3888 RepID=A0A9D5AFY5_PEA|nr:hypothetical protein KIW84_055579 [Pisum sativum]